MKKFVLLFIACLLRFEVMAASPTYSSFDPSQFASNNFNISITNHAALTNVNHFGNLTILTLDNGTTGWLRMTNQTGIEWYGGSGLYDGASIWYNFLHSNEPELQLGSSGSFSFTEGMDAQGKSMNHVGGSGRYHGFWFIQYDDGGMISPTAPNGFSHFFGFAAHNWDGTGTTTNDAGAVTHYAGWRYEIQNTNGTGALVYYDKIKGWNQFTTEQSNRVAGKIMGMNFTNALGGGVQFPNAWFTNALNRGVQQLGTVSSTVVLDYQTNDFKTVLLNGATITLVTSNLTSIDLGGRLVLALLQTSDTAATTLNFPSDWQWVTTKPTSISADTSVLLRLTAFGNTDVATVAEWLSGSRTYSYSPEATAYFTATGASFTKAQKNAINNFVLAAEAHGYKTKLLFYPFFGDSGDGVANSKYLLGNSNITWGGTGTTHGSSSVTFNGSGYGDLGVSPSTFFSSKDTGMLFVWCTTQTPTDNAYFIGVTATSSHYAALLKSSGAFAVGGINLFQVQNGPGVSADFRHFLAANRENSGTQTIYVDNTTAGNATTSTGLLTGNFFIGGRNSNGSFASGSAYTAIFAGAGNNMTAQNMTDFYNDLLPLKTALGK